MDTQAIAEKKRAALMSVLAALLLTALKIAVGVSTGSLGILAEAAHSALDLVAAGVTFFAIQISVRPADRHHAYGHGKVENLAALAETLLLLLTCGWIIHEALDRLFWNPSPVRITVWAFVVMLISIVIDFNRARMLARVAKKYKSQALEADALHFSTDIMSSAVVILGLAAVWGASLAPAGSFAHQALLRADSIAALVVAVIVAWVSLRLGYKAIDVLLDAGSKDSFRAIEEAVESVPEVLSLKELRLRQSGPHIFADMQLVLPAATSLEFAHAVSDSVEQAVHAVLPEADLSIHCEPEHPEDGLYSRVQRLGLKCGLDVHSVEIYRAEKGNYLTLHAAIGPAATLASAHSCADQLEGELKKLGFSDALIHIEPRQVDSRHSLARELDLPDEERAAIRAVLDEAIAAEEGVSGYHKLLLLDLGAEWSLSLHVCMPGHITVLESHQAITRIEKHLHKHIPQLGRISIHADVLEGIEALED